MNKPISLLCAVLLSAAIMFYPSTFALASPSIAWSRTYGGVGMDAVQSVIQTRDGGFLLAGSCHILWCRWERFLAGKS